MKKILVTGAAGQIGSELVPALVEKYGAGNVVATDYKPLVDSGCASLSFDILDAARLEETIRKYEITEIYHLVSLLSATGEKDPDRAWNLNMGSLKSVLDLAAKYQLRVFWPSSIAAFGPTTPRNPAPQKTVLEPTTMYGVTKVSGELLCQYYFLKKGVDVRSVRYPGLISWKAEPGGGTTDYAVAVFYEALKTGTYTCFVRPDTVLPMMYMDDAVRGTIELMETPAEKITIRTSYNLAGVSFSAEELVAQINKHRPVSVSYAPDHRQQIADSWPQVIDDTQARADWGWKPVFDTAKMTEVMLEKLAAKLQIPNA